MVEAGGGAIDRYLLIAVLQPVYTGMMPRGHNVPETRGNLAQSS